MKKIIGIIVLLLVLTGCQSNSTELDRVREERDVLERHLTEVETENTVLQEELSKSEDDIAQMTQQVDELTTTLENIQDGTLKVSESGQLIQTAFEVMHLLKEQDFEALSTWVHDEEGVRFSPYFYVNPGTDIVMTANEVANLAQDTSIYNWGTYDGIGDPIDLTFAEYYDRFIYDQDFANPEIVGNNTAIQVGNMYDNHDEVYPNGEFVEFHFSGFEEEYAGLDWRSLRLVFLDNAGQWKLVAIIHGEWTI